MILPRLTDSHTTDLRSSSQTLPNGQHVRPLCFDSFVLFLFELTNKIAVSAGYLSAFAISRRDTFAAYAAVKLKKKIPTPTLEYSVP